MTSELETNIVAVERIKEYSETQPEVRCISMMFVVNKVSPLRDVTLLARRAVLAWSCS